MPNIRRKQWTPTTPANAEDAQFWEDHLIGDTELKDLEDKKHWHDNKDVLDELAEDEEGNLNYKGEKIGGGVENAFSYVKVGNTTIDASEEDTFELAAGSNISMTVDGKKVIINSAGGGGGSQGGDMYKSEFVLPGGTGQVLSAKSADKATAVGNADTNVLEGLSDKDGRLMYNDEEIGGKVEIDNDTITENEQGQIQVDDAYIKNKFTQKEWNDLPQTEKDKFDGKEVIITDDYDSNICSSVAECNASTNPNDVAGASAVKELYEKLINKIEYLTNGGFNLSDYKFFDLVLRDNTINSALFTIRALNLTETQRGYEILFANDKNYTCTFTFDITNSGNITMNSGKVTASTGEAFTYNPPSIHAIIGYR